MANLFSDQNLGYALEIILTNEIRSPHQTQVTGANVTAYYRAHPQLSNLLTVATPEEKKELAKFTNNGIAATAAALDETVSGDKKRTSFRAIIGTSGVNTVSGGTGAFDVETASASIHVKLNQSKTGQRVIGLGLPKKGEKGTQFGIALTEIIRDVMNGADAKDRIENLLVESMAKSKAAPAAKRKKAQALIKQYLNPATGLPKKGGEGGSGSNDFAATKAAIKAVYRDFAPQIYGDISPLAEKLWIDLQDRVFSPIKIKGRKVILFAKYVAGKGGTGVQLHLECFQLAPTKTGGLPLILDFVTNGTRMPYGVIYLSNKTKKENIVFSIEIRTDGEGQPPQLKLGNLETLSKFMTYRPIGKTTKTSNA
jgi:hypothetical protein